MNHTDKLLKLRERPDLTPVMHNVWINLLFLHWEIEREAIQKLLPSGLSVDTYHGKAFVGLVPFQMDQVRFHRLPTIPGTSRFWETNLRTYVIGPDGNPGVWFFSLEASNLLAVKTARKWFGLPYHHATMEGDWSEGWKYKSMRKSGSGSSTIIAKNIPTNFNQAEPGTWEFWAVERYLLYSQNNSKLMHGFVHHAPYQIAQIESCIWSTDLFEQASLPTPDSTPLVHASPGVNVEIFAPEGLGLSYFCL